MNIAKLIESKEVRTVMGVDASSTSIAFSYFDGGELELWGKVYINGSNNYEKAADAYSKFAALCGNTSPHLVVIESSVYVNNNGVMRQLSMMMGAIAAAAINSGCDVNEVPPITWQSYIGNKNFTKAEKEAMRSRNPEASASKMKEIMRSERKQRTIDFVKSNLGVTVDDNDAADAVGVGYYGIKVLAGTE